MPASKICKQCGQTKPLTQDNFRKYYNRTGFYTICKSCEKVNTRFKYLLSKQKAGAITVGEDEELRKFNEYFSLLRKQGLQPPNAAATKETPVDIDALIAQETEDIARKEELGTEDITIPVELAEWLTKDLSQFDAEYLQDTVMDELHAKYRPTIGTGDRGRPIYDDRFRDVLTSIQDRFDEYEEDSL